MKHLAWLALAAILLACPLVALADEAADTFNELYSFHSPFLSACNIQDTIPRRLLDSCNKG